jgi:transcriptional regulator with XRE-family HTH domain
MRDFILDIHLLFGMSMTKLVAKKIKLLRDANDIKQEVIAAELHIRQSSYSKLESGKASITLEQLVVICRVFGISIEDFFSGLDGKTNFKNANQISYNEKNLYQQLINRLHGEVDYLKSLYNEKKLSERLLKTLQKEVDYFKGAYEDCKKSKSKQIHKKTKV